MDRKREDIYKFFEWINKDIENFKVFYKWIGPECVLTYFLDYFCYDEATLTSDAFLELYLDAKNIFKMPDKTVNKVYFSLWLSQLNSKIKIIGLLIYIPIKLYKMVYLFLLKLFDN